MDPGRRFAKGAATKWSMAVTMRCEWRPQLYHVSMFEAIARPAEWCTVLLLVVAIARARDRIAPRDDLAATGTPTPSEQQQQRWS